MIVLFSTFLMLPRFCGCTIWSWHSSSFLATRAAFPGPSGPVNLQVLDVEQGEMLEPLPKAPSKRAFPMAFPMS